MCGIAGHVSVVPSRDAVSTMLSTIKHRGPDGSGIWESPHVILGHVRLAIISLGTDSNQPMQSNSRALNLTYNGEIYNYKELKRELSADYNFKTASDTEVILAAWEKWGIECLNKLRGMFAFALKDETTQLTYLVRDRFGIKPLYYLQTNSGLYFCSEIKGIVRGHFDSNSPNMEKVALYLGNRLIDSDNETLFSGIYQVGPGEIITVNHAGKIIAQNSWWNFPTHFGSSDSHLDAAQIFRNSFTESVRYHLVADVPRGAFVSGGLDSSSVACLASTLLDQGELSQYSIITPSDDRTQENRLIPLVQKQVGGKAIDVTIEDSNFIADLPALIYQQEEPFGDASIYAHSKLCQQAKQNGTKVLLSGNGGDELLCGYPGHTYAYLGSLAQSLQFGQWVRALGSLNHFRPESLPSLLAHTLFETNIGKMRTLRKRSAFVSEVSHLCYDFSVPNFELPIDWPKRYASFWQRLTLPQFLHYEDRNSMAVGVEIRVPFVDHVLLESVMKFDPMTLLGNGSKSILRQGLKGLVPDPVLGQIQKEGFPAPLEKFLRVNPKKTLDLFETSVRRTPFFDQKRSATIADEFLFKKNSKMLHRFWRTLSLAIWYDIFFNHPSPSN